ncbi:type VI secretion system tip protein VgrG, partial [Neisseriaceae bacterium TC5R-5]|nr:type VI secretion system tip protein VgrG [Neisseriaceae bacterium TC5R-5]
DVLYRHPSSQPKPVIKGVQSAVVVTPEGEEIWTDQWARVRIRLFWDRLANNDAGDSFWVRVSQNWAGDQFGSISLPRAGDEVLVTFIDGDPDKPIITGRCYNGQHLAPWELASQQALTGIRSRELGGSRRGNQLILDDSAQQIQAILSSDHQNTLLGLGALTHIPNHQGRRDPAGEGFTLSTLAWGSLHADQGLHLSSWKHTPLSGSHTEMSRPLASLQQAQQQIHSHSQLASQQGAEALAAEDPNQQLIDSLSGPERAELTKPVLSLASPAGIISSTDGSTHMVSGEHHSVTSTADTNLSVGRSLVATVKNTISLFVQTLGMKLIAMADNIHIEAQNGHVVIRAKKKIVLDANEIQITAKTKTTINGGGSFATLSASEYTHHTSGPWTVHAAKHELLGPSAINPLLLLATTPAEMPCVLPATPQRIFAPTLTAPHPQAGISPQNSLTSPPAAASTLPTPPLHESAAECAAGIPQYGPELEQNGVLCGDYIEMGNPDEGYTTTRLNG